MRFTWDCWADSAGLPLLLQLRREHLSREELELIDLEKQMEEQLFMQHREVERVVASKTEPVAEAGDGRPATGGLKYLVKVRQGQRSAK